MACEASGAFVAEMPVEAVAMRIFGYLRLPFGSAGSAEQGFVLGVSIVTWLWQPSQAVHTEVAHPITFFFLRNDGVIF